MTRTSRRVPEEKAASKTDFTQAINSLTAEQTERIDKFLKNRVNKLGPAAFVENVNDSGEEAYKELLNQAVCRVLEGRRRWNPKKVDIVGFLIGAIQSISNEIARKLWRQKKSDRVATPVRETQIIWTDEEGQERSPLANAQFSVQDPEAQLITYEEELEYDTLVKQIEVLFEKDDEALLVIEGLKEGKDGPAIKEDLGLTEKEFRTIMRRIQRTIQRERLKRPGYGK